LVFIDAIQNPDEKDGATFGETEKTRNRVKKHKLDKFPTIG
jgi:hypothetical protein